jgi:DNA-directed RNA polymerase specialized sigma24 family protein
MVYQTDEQLLKAVRIGVPSAYLTLFDRYYSGIERYAHCLHQEASAAARTASTTFALAFRQANRKHADRLPYPAELYRLCRRIALRGQLRMYYGGMRPRSEEQSDEHESFDFAELSLSVILCQERDALIQSAIDHLSLPDRDIIYLAFEPSLNRELISLIVKMPSECVTARLYQALRRLGAVVRHTGFTPTPIQEIRPKVGKHSTRT